MTKSLKNKRIAACEKQKLIKQIKQKHREIKNDLRQPTNTNVKVGKPQKSKPNPIKAPESQFDKNRKIALSLLSSIQQPNKEEIGKIKDVSRAFVGDVNKLIAEADVILQVIDARDPLGTRCKDTENLILNQNKTLIFLLNKIDLVPNDNMKRWVEYLSKEALVIPFKASIQKQSKNIGGSKNFLPSVEVIGKASSFGVDRVFNQLRNIAKTQSTEGANKLKVAVVGMPNTGKSSVINSIKRKKICEAGNNPGLTRSLQEVAIDKHITLVDSPGVIKAVCSDPAEYALRNCIRIEKIEDPEMVAEAVYNRCKVQLEEVYQLQKFNSFDEFILLLAMRCCPLRKGGVADIRAASVKLLKDWNTGNILYYNEPPTHGVYRTVSEPVSADNLVSLDVEMTN